MAIINSLAVRGARKSMGGITYTQLKGQNVSKQQVGKKGAIPPDNRTPAQNRMTNIVLAFQLLAGFLSLASGLRKPVESIYNAFVRGWKSLISDTVVTTRPEAVLLLVGLAGLAGNLVRTGINVISAISYQVTIASLGLPFVEGLVCRTARIDATGSVIVAELAVTEAMYNAGLVTAMVSTGDDIMIGAYIYFTGGKKCSNIVFEPAFV